MTTSINLSKGGNISLTKIAGAALQNVVIACGWDANRKKGGKSYDLDVSAVGLDASGEVPNIDDPTDAGYQEWFIYANHRKDSRGSVVFMGDNRTGEGEGDDELIEVALTRVPVEIERIVFAVVIWQADQRGGQRFGDVDNSFIRVFDKSTGNEFARYNLGADFAEETLVMFGELYRRGEEWKFRALGEGYDAPTFRKQHNIARPFETDYARYSN